MEVVLATGGTGVTGRDVTPEAFAEVYEKEIPGFGELFPDVELRFDQYLDDPVTGDRLAWPVALICSPCPARPAPAVMPGTGFCLSQLDIRHKPCNFAELLPRLQEI